MPEATPRVRRIVSGGQTGADRAALDAALEAGFPCGGWCPEGRQAEDGPLPLRYPLVELPSGGYDERTIRNVEDSDGTVVFYVGHPSGGTELTLAECIRQRKPYRLIDAAEIPAGRAAEILRDFVAESAIGTLNVAGPRASLSQVIYAYVLETMRTFIAGCRPDA